MRAGIICVICRDDFLEAWEPVEFDNNQPSSSSSAANSHNQNSSHMVATKCGHLFHKGCLHQWFSKKRSGAE